MRRSRLRTAKQGNDLKYKFITEKRILSDIIIKFENRHKTIRYGKEKAKQQRQVLQDAENYFEKLPMSCRL